MTLIAGLGNPGPQYAKTRHNIGFMVLDLLIARLNPAPVKKEAFKGELYKSSSLFLLKPMTCMNLSGESVAKVAHFYQIENVIVVYDDMDLPFGAIRFKHGGGSGGHNGLKSIDACMGSDYVRIRGGIGKPAIKSEVVNYVLNDFSPQEKPHMESFLSKMADCAELLLREPMEIVASKYSQKKIDLANL